MSTITSSAILLAINLGLVWLLLAAPFGTRTLVVRKRIEAAPQMLWSALHPLGQAANWHPGVVSSRPGPSAGQVRQSLGHPDRLGRPIERLLSIVDHADSPCRFTTRIVEDSTLDPVFWKHFREERRIDSDGDAAIVTVAQTDRYRGAAFLLYRYFVLRRELAALDGWAKTGKVKTGGFFEHPLTQVLLAVVSTLLLWPFFGLTGTGLALSTMLTVVIVLHELGHMAAYRAFGHETARMIFVPFLGGIAIGGRPYNTVFEVAVCALMGAGMSAFLVPIVITVHESVVEGLLPSSVGPPTLMFLLILGAFNLLNLLPMYRFDGGQVLRQIFRRRRDLALASFGVTLAVLAVGWRVGLPSSALAAGLAVFTLMSLFGFGSVKPREALEPMTAAERLLTAFGLYAAIGIHGYAIIHACKYLFS